MCYNRLQKHYTKGANNMATISVRLDDATKAQLDSFCRNVGSNTSTIMKMFATKVAREQRLPFTVEVDPFFSDVNQERIAKGIADLEAGGPNWHEHELIEDGDEEVVV
jgi:DNA-damage-inducible protein J